MTIRYQLLTTTTAALLLTLSCTAAASAAEPASAAVCTHPGWNADSPTYGNFISTANNIGIRSGPNMPCPQNGAGQPGNFVRVDCYYANSETVWYFIHLGDVRGWVPVTWIDAWTDPGQC
jgi:hypothetical protein